MKWIGYFIVGLIIATGLVMSVGPYVGGVIAFAFLYANQMIKPQENKKQRDRVAEAYQKYLDEKETGS
ncbi:hypothetical protein [Jeotgalibacillus salarius]|uniref:Uncharacterized protein n=1 Tax=Jeotgalibacillus salarius TaxID=546023 RepID=A0A4Y8LH14_9BACL|nr:hypothetical protein [Jeotgalibacillus salarius]TFE01740.1 hypothetical protein E2626_09235 [Jeotgalibacillus salarius]